MAKSLLAKEPQELLRIQPVPAHQAPVEKQHRHIQPVASEQLGVAIDVYYCDRGQAHLESQGPQLRHHFVAQITALPVHHGQVGMAGARARAQWRGPLIGAGPCVEKELAMERTVSGGTSPTAVTFLPPMTVEYTDEEPSLADSSVTVCS